LTLVALASRAHAQRAEAQDAFERGRKLMKDGDYPAACAAFETSLKLENATGTLYNLGLCHEKQGRIASAWAELKQVAETDTNKGRAADAAKRVAALEPRLTRMKLVVTDPVPGLAVERDGIDVTTFIDQPVPVDPRIYKFKVTAPGQQSIDFEKALDKEGETIEVAIPKFGTVVVPDPVVPVVPTGYPQQLALRPIAVPNGVAEVIVTNTARTSSAFNRSPIEGELRGRYGIQQFELGLLVRMHERFEENDKPNPLFAIGGSLVYSIKPMFAGRLEYTRVHPFGKLGESAGGSDLRVELARKQLLSPKITLDGTAGFLFLQRSNGGFSANELIGEADVGLQFTATDKLAFEASALVQLNLGGELFDHTVTLAVAPTALFAASKQIDVFARIFVGLLPAAEGSSSSDLRTYTVGLNWRP
jgi:hypothetical protein